MEANLKWIKFLLIGYKKTIELLIEKGANVNAENKWKWTPLHYVVSLDPLFGGHEDWTDDDYLSKFKVYIYDFK